ncbi:DNA primase [Nocardia blacklockiae]|uniref:DNA primase n=1 Tax=Nocardia blacklockiae TaxID=480036 RepID=UPI0018935636|nr:DNA primase [Nocardia blacklockiae]MBF6171121.1 DNA primase [Nocardia blacklockiae]
MKQSGRIPEREIEAVRDLAHVEQIIGAYVALRPAGADSLKGLCPFHDEKTPSFHVRPSHGRFHCFGCGEGGDVFTFLQKHEQIGFREAVELAADRVGHRLRYEGGGPSAAADRNTRARLVAATAAAAEFYSDQLSTPDAATARQFLQQRDFDSTIIEHFGCGYAPTNWDRLTKHLLQKGFTARELETAGLSRPGRNGMIDRFRGRLVWPIRSRTGEVTGFGARRIYSDDPIDAKYLNSPETPLYKKSHVLFGIDHAKRRIASTHQAVVVEGYTDVMAMHAAGITNTVAACGTAFGEHHLTTLRRMTLDDSDWRAEIIYMFDGDTAGTTAATKAFGHAAAMPGRSSVVIVPDGRDPCELRQQDGDTALHHLLDARGPLIDFVLRSAISEFDLTDVSGRIAAAGQARTLIGRIHDPLTRTEYARQAAGWCGVDATAILGTHATPNQPEPPAPPPERDRTHLQRTVLHGALHHASHAAANGFDDLPVEAFDQPDCARLRQAIADSGGTAAASDPAGWVSRLIANLEADSQLAHELVVTPFPVSKADAGVYIATAVVGLHDSYLADRIAQGQNPALITALRQRRAELHANPASAAPTATASPVGTVTGTEQTRERRTLSHVKATTRSRGPRP